MVVEDVPFFAHVFRNTSTSVFQAWLMKLNCFVHGSLDFNAGHELHKTRRTHANMNRFDEETTIKRGNGIHWRNNEVFGKQYSWTEKKKVQLERTRY